MRRAVLLAAAMLVLVAACAGLPGNQGDAGAPILVSGIVRNKQGIVYAGARLVLHLVGRDDEASATETPTYLRRFTSAWDGTFALRVAPTQELLDFSAASGGRVTFRVVVIFPAEFKGATATFDRTLDGSTWSGDVPTIELQQEPDD